MLDLEYSPEWEQSFLWCVYLALVLAFFLAFGMGANDCANSYGCVYGAKVLDLWQIYALATIFETLGAGLLGYRVTKTMRKSIVDVDIYNVSSNFNSTTNQYELVDQCPKVNSTVFKKNEYQNCSTYTSGEFILGELGALGGTAAWLIFATLVQMPVSTTHSAVGGTVGFSLVLRGTGGINWKMIGNIVISWVASPLLAGLVGSMFYLIIKFLVLRRKDPFESALHVLPGFFWFAIFISNGNCCSDIPEVSVTPASLNGYINSSETKVHPSLPLTPPGTKDETTVETIQSKSTIKVKMKDFWRPAEEDLKTIKVFHFLQVLSACFLSFSHGSNDTANAVGPLVGLWLTYKYGLASVNADHDITLELLILFGAGSMIIGLWCLGHKVIKTIGNQITTVTAPSGFCMELASAFTVIMGSRLGIPLSTTHCMVGAVVIVGYVKNPEKGVAWRVFGNICIAWIVTLPVAMGISGLITYLLAHFYYGSL